MAIGHEHIARFKPGDNLPVYATGANIEAGHLVTISGRNAKNAYIAAHTGAGLYASGVAEVDAIADKTDWRGGTNIARRGSVARVVAGAAVAVGVAVKADATGRAIAQAGAGVIVGYAVQAAAAAGDVIDVDLI